MTLRAVSHPPRRAQDTDAALIERSWHEPERFADVFDRYYGELHGFVARLLGASLADDLASETFLIAFDRRARLAAALVAIKGEREVLPLVAWAGLSCDGTARALGIPPARRAHGCTAP